MTTKSVPHYASLGSMKTDEPDDDASILSSLDSDSSSQWFMDANEDVQNTSSNTALEATPRAFRGMVCCDSSMDMYFDTVPTPHAQDNPGRPSFGLEDQLLEEGAPQQFVFGLSCVDTSLDLYGADDAGTTVESGGASHNEKRGLSLSRGSMVGHLSSGSCADLCAPTTISQSKSMPGRIGSKKLPAVSETQTFLDSEVPDMDAGLRLRPPVQRSGFEEALHLLFNMQPATAADIQNAGAA